MSHAYTPNASEINDDIQNDPFWLDLKVSEFITERRIPSEYDRTMTRSTLLIAIAEINNDCESWKQEQIANGFESIEDLKGPVLDGKPQQVYLYKAAVFSNAKAKLLTHFETLNQRDEADNLSKSGQQTANSLLTESTQAVRAMVGIGRATAVLIE